VAGLLSANNILTSAAVNSGKGSTLSVNNTYKYDADKYPVNVLTKSTAQYSGQDPDTDSVNLKLNYGK
jgi:hypothetical protein